MARHLQSIDPSGFKLMALEVANQHWAPPERGSQLRRNASSTCRPRCLPALIR